MHTYLLFDSIHQVMKAESLLKTAGIDTDLVPVPKEISSDCGMCVAFRQNDLQLIMAALSHHPFSCTVRIYRRAAPQGYNLIADLPPASS
ncbi:MAG: DUF3343 domain-containing protein [Deltaproteobacteria bacterium]|nr:DUF3343 domain-containing protein [Candidatus Anaeroferrophillus wilburensis]MBN2890142.1 DUF3343 domain-containing protein [Deltaproteobacteria bacterium]